MLTDPMGPTTTVTRRLSFVGTLLCMAACLPTFVIAQGSSPATGAEIDVRSVKFSKVRPPGGGDAWLETTVEVATTVNPAGGVYARFADRVQVTLSLSVKKRDNELDFFRASAEAVVLEAGRTAFRFYLPPEVLRREQMSTDPFAFAVELVTGGREVAVGPDALSSTLRAPDVLRSFKDRVAQTGPRNDGVLVPQYLSPFSAAFGSDTPSFVRRER